jgi:hypothetical protein
MCRRGACPLATLAVASRHTIRGVLNPVQPDGFVSGEKCAIMIWRNLASLPDLARLCRTVLIENKSENQSNRSKETNISGIVGCQAIPTLYDM